MYLWCSDLVEECCVSTEEVDETETEVYLWCSDLVEERRVSSEEVDETETDR